MLKTAKCQWIARPRKVRITGSRSLVFEADGFHQLVWTAGEEDEKISFHHEGNMEFGAGIILSIDQGILLMDSPEGLTLTLSVLGVESTSTFHGITSQDLTVTRRGDKVSFSKDGNELCSLRFQSIAASVSIAFAAKGKGEASFRFS